MSRFAPIVALAICLSLPLAACAEEELEQDLMETATTTTERDEPASGTPPATAEVPEIECPPELSGCETAGGEVLYVERVDPDGDGDAHFVLLSRESITAPGISVIDVRPDLRPDPLPGPGDLISAAGPVYEGSYGQRQIQAEAVEVEAVP